MMKFFDEKKSNDTRQTLSQGILNIMSRRLSEIKGIKVNDRKESEKAGNLLEDLEVESE